MQKACLPNTRYKRWKTRQEASKTDFYKIVWARVQLLVKAAISPSILISASTSTTTTPRTKLSSLSSLWAQFRKNQTKECESASANFFNLCVLWRTTITKAVLKDKTRFSRVSNLRVWSIFRLKLENRICSLSKSQSFATFKLITKLKGSVSRRRLRSLRPNWKKKDSHYATLLMLITNS